MDLSNNNGTVPNFNFFPTIVPTFACLLSTYLDNGQRSYEGYQVLRVDSGSSDKAFNLMVNLLDSDGYDFWNRPSKQNPTDVLVPPSQLETLKSLLDLVAVPYDILIDNLERELEQERRQNLARQTTNVMTWTSYHRLETIYSWQDSLAEQYPDLVTILTIGKSFEGRPLRVIKISNAKAGESKKSVWLDGGIHAREWISPATVSFMANQLIQKFQTNDTHLVDMFNWYIDTNVNPDGYEYTWTVDRMWRKTRSNFVTTKMDSSTRSIFDQFFGCCKGSDPNRNFDHFWGGKGTSKNKCSEIYHGPHAASEPEVKAVQDFLLEKKDEIKLLITFHSYSQMILLPWGHSNVRTDDYDQLMAVGNKAASTLQAVHGTKYRVGPSPELLYPAAGGTEDFAKGVAGIKYAYCIELRDEGRYGFILPPNQIIASGQETFEAVKSMAEDVYKTL